MENIVNINYAQTGKTTNTNELGMRQMQAKAYEARNKQYILLVLSFTEVIMQAFRNEYLGGYTNLVYEQSGISILPLSFYESLPQPVNRTIFIIDFSSLIILYQIAKEHNITFPNKFLISTFTVDMIRRELRKNQLEPKSELSVVVTSEGITKYQIPENMQQNNIKYLEGLLKWIQENCESNVDLRRI